RSPSRPAPAAARRPGPARTGPTATARHRRARSRGGGKDSARASPRGRPAVPKEARPRSPTRGRRPRPSGTAEGPRLSRSGAVGDLLSAIEALPPSARPVALEVMRARCLSRRLDFGRAYAELSRWVRSAPGLDAELQLVLAEMAI